jgi:hypothetical protein
VTISSNDLVTAGPASGTTWTISAFTSSVSVYMTDLTILASNGICVTGFIFTYSDGTTQTTGAAGDTSVTLSFGNSNQWTAQLINRVKSFTGLIVDLIEICIPSGTCVSAGNTAKNLGSANNVGPSDVITSFYGTYEYWNVPGIDCLNTFGVNYY